VTGWVKIHRDLTYHHLWTDKPFTKGQAWVDLILLANHEDTKFMLGNQLIEAKRGEVITSEMKLMERWGWSKSKVRAFLQLLQLEEMIVKKTDRKKTILTLTNYCIWQDSQTMNEPQKDHQKTTKKPQKDTIKNYKNYKNDKNKIIKDIVEYMNQVCGTNYRPSAKETISHISARLKDGFVLEDFKKVIDLKFEKWGNDLKMSPYLRPQTLFGTKFESYLNERGGTIENGGNKKPSKYAHIVNSYEPDPNLKFDDPDIF
jgi:uncharacterized phage protein (TIGR02220 family)